MNGTMNEAHARVYYGRMRGMTDEALRAEAEGLYMVRAIRLTFGGAEGRAREWEQVANTFRASMLIEPGAVSENLFQPLVSEMADVRAGKAHVRA